MLQCCIRIIFDEQGGVFPRLLACKEEFMMEKETVSVIVPVYNNEKYIKKCINSIRTQTWKDLEILVIDDGSSDDSGNILEKLAETDTRIRLIHQKNAGVAAARNKGLDLSSGTYLVFVDGDDFLAPDYIEKFLICAREKNAELVICGLTYVDETGKTLKKIIPGTYKRFVKEEWTARISAVCSHFYKRSLWEKYQVRFQDGERGEDMPISLLFSALCDKICTLSECGYFYVQHADSARHNFKGLRRYRLPYQALENTIQKVETEGVKNSQEYYEWFVLRILCTCFFQLGIGASTRDMRELTDYIVRILRQYFPNYYKNSKISVLSGADVPLTQKLAAAVFIILVRTKMIYPVSRMLSRPEKR